MPTVLPTVGRRAPTKTPGLGPLRPTVQVVPLLARSRRLGHQTPGLERVSLRLTVTDYSKVDSLGLQYKSGNFGAEKSPADLQDVPPVAQNRRQGHCRGTSLIRNRRPP